MHLPPRKKQKCGNVLSQRVDDAVSDDTLYVVKLGDVVTSTLARQRRVKDGGEGEHAEERRVQVARVVVTLDALQTTYVRHTCGGVKYM